MGTPLQEFRQSECMDMENSSTTLESLGLLVAQYFVYILEMQLIVLVVTREGNYYVLLLLKNVVLRCIIIAGRYYCILLLLCELFLSGVRLIDR